jgi:hypothetical protein
MNLRNHWLPHFKRGKKFYRNFNLLNTMAINSLSVLDFCREAGECFFFFLSFYIKGSLAMFFSFFFIHALHLPKV